ncbi:MAG: MFS transporter [Candidatus Sumerlaeota bacterium]|nr:MFS transporter [Candidatus Sumerlaeota bacterium]
MSVADPSESGSRQAPPAGIHPVVKATGFVSLFTDMGSEIIYPLLPAFLTQNLHFSKAVFGLIQGVEEGTPAIVRYFSGVLSDRVNNRKWLILAGYTLSSIAKPFIGLAQLVAAAFAPLYVLVLRVLDKIGKGIRGAPRDGLVADFSEHARGRAFGFQRAMDHAGAVCGGLLAFLMLRYLHFSLMKAILLSAIPGVLTIVTILFFIHEKPGRAVAPSKPAESSAGAGTSAASAPLSRNFYLYLVSAALFSLANSSDSFLLLRANELGMAVAMQPLAWVALHLSKMTFTYIGGGLSDRFGRKPLLLGGWVIYAIVYLGFAWANSLPSIWSLFIVYGLFYGATEGTAKAFVADLVPSAARGRAFGILGMAEGLLAIVTGLAIGELWQHTGDGRIPLAVEAALALVAAVWLAVAVKPAPFRKTA